mmetsp:Transcript_19593/g.35987  ORF Transcript_19593/g.35987 Transcript_19593/m.35987 type:complete len:291 (+) Transcript_19593:1194-2066(+)
MRKSSSCIEGKLHSPDVLEWLKKRYFNVSKERYLLKEDELRKADEIKEVFKGFDYDGSGFLELSELWAMFLQYGLKIERNELRELFAVIKPVHRDKLSLNEFRAFALSEEANKKFHQMMQRAKRSEMRKPPEQQKFIPTDISSMMKHLVYLTRTQFLVKQIGSSSIKNDIDVFYKIFSMKPSNLEVQRESPSETPTDSPKPRRRRNKDYRSYLKKRIEGARKVGKASALHVIKNGLGYSESQHVTPTLRLAMLPMIEVLKPRSNSQVLNERLPRLKGRHSSVGEDFPVLE